MHRLFVGLTCMDTKVSYFVSIPATWKQLWGRGLCVRHAYIYTFWLLWRCLNLWFHMAQFCSPQTQCNVSRAWWCCGEWPVASLATTASQTSLCVYVNGWNDCRTDCIGWRDGYRQESRMYDTIHPVNMYGLLYKHQKAGVEAPTAAGL